MKIEFVDLKRQNRFFREEFVKIFAHIMLRADFIMGETLEKFERNFARFCRKKYCLGLNSGTDALMLVLLAYGVGPDDEVITVPNSYFSTAMVISNVGARTVFLDINPESYTIDPKKIEEKITKKTRAIIPVHLYGQAAEMGPIVKLAKKYKLFVIEDCCQAHGAKYKGSRVPITETGAFSFYPGKNLGAFGDGGAVVTDNKKVRDELELLRNDGSRKKYEHLSLGYKSRLDALQAAILDFKLKHLNDFTRKRRRAAKLYNRHLAGIKQIKTPKEMVYAYHVYHLYVIECLRRNSLQEFLSKAGVTTIIHYPTPIHLQRPYREQGYKRGDFPITEEKAKRILSLPMFPEITEEEIKYIAEKIKDFYLKT